MDLKYLHNRIDNKAEFLLYGYVGDEINGDMLANEIKWLEDNGVNEFTLRINSGGGSVINGMSLVAQMFHSKSKFITINDGYAASMGSVILMAGDEVKSLDFSLVMVHNPSLFGVQLEEMEECKEKRFLMSVRDQISILMQNRTGKSKEEVDQLMLDETWFSAKEAKKHGIIDEIIKSTKKPKISNEMQIDDMIQNLAAFKYIDKKPDKMDKLTNYLKLNNDANEDSIIAKVKEIEDSSVENQLRIEELEKDLTEANNKVEDSKTTIETLQNDLKEANDKLQEIENKKIEEFVENAVKDGKIKEDDKDKSFATAKKDFETFKNIIDSIQLPHLNVLDQLEENEISDSKKDWNCRDWEQKDPKGLKKMMREEPKKYEKLFNEFYKTN